MSNVTPNAAKKSFFQQLRTLKEYLVEEYSDVPEAEEIVESAYFHLCTWLDNSSMPECPIRLVTEEGKPITEGELHEEFFAEMEKVEDESIEESTEAPDYTQLIGLTSAGYQRLEELHKKVKQAEEEAGEESKDIALDKVFTTDELDEYFYLISRLIAEDNYKRLYDIEEEAADRVWYNRNLIGTEFEKPGTSEEIRATALENKKRIEEAFDISEEDVDDYYHGYWSGILALSRFLNGYTEELEVLRTGEMLLDT